MKIDPQRLNAIYNAAKDLVGDQGAFILFFVKPDGDQEDLQLRIFGPDVRLTGLLTLGSQRIDQELRERAAKKLPVHPQEPD